MRAKNQSGSAGFSAITYRGIPVKHDYIDDGTAVSYFKHMFRVRFGGGRGRHACLQLGYWCWADAFEHPLDIRKWWIKQHRHKSR